MFAGSMYLLLYGGCFLSVIALVALGAVMVRYGRRGEKTRFVARSIAKDDD